MNTEAARSAANCLLKGVFDVFDALLAKSFQFEIQDVVAVNGEALFAWLDSFPVALRARVARGLGQVTLLLSEEDASRFAAEISGEPPRPDGLLKESDTELLREVGESALGGGVTNLLEAAGRSVEKLDETFVEQMTSDSAETLLSFLGGQPAGIPFLYRGADLNGQAVLLFSESMSNMMPGASRAAAGSAAPAMPLTQATLSPEEMTDILSGFGASAPAPAPPPPVAPHPPQEEPPNLDMVLDIRLVATARLGRVDMPIGEILTLGPGSIVEVGHLVDEPVELLINDRLIARGDVVVVDEKFGLRITEIVSPQERVKSLQ